MSGENRSLTKQDVEMLKEAFKGWDVEARKKTLLWGLSIGISVGVCLFTIIVFLGAAMALANWINK